MRDLIRDVIKTQALYSKLGYQLTKCL